MRAPATRQRTQAITRTAPGSYGAEPLSVAPSLEALPWSGPPSLLARARRYCLFPGGGDGELGPGDGELGVGDGELGVGDGVAAFFTTVSVIFLPGET